MSTGLTGRITDAEIATLLELSHVKQVSPIIQIPVTIKTGKYTASFHATATAFELLDAEMSWGDLPNEAGNVPDFLLGYYQTQMFIDPQNPPNYMNWEEMNAYKPAIDWETAKMTLTLGYDVETDSMASEENTQLKSKEYLMQVKGITKESYNESSYSSYISLTSAKRLLTENRKLVESLNISLNGYNQVIIVVDVIENVKDILDTLKEKGYEAYSAMESIEQVQEEQQRQQSQLFFIGFVTLFVSAIGIANTMYANILERRREIAIMKVVGMPLGKIRIQFLLESACIGGFGGLLGIGISYLISAIFRLNSGEVSFLGMYFSDGMRLDIPLWLSISALGISMVVGILSGLYPAYQATKMSPMEAIRGN